MTRNPIILIDKLRRAGLGAAEIRRRTGVPEATIRKLRRGTNAFDLAPDQVARLAQLAAEVSRSTA